MRVGSSSSLSSVGFEASCSIPVDDPVVKKIRSFGKYFSTRLVQVVVQSRTNERFDLSCCPPGPSSNNWFNVRVDELGEVSAQIRKSTAKFPPEVPSFCIDFFLYTKDGESLPLESWCFSFDTERRCAEDNVNIYHDLSTLLKSSMAAARMTPMHRYYVKKQGPDTFVILYRIVEGPSSLDLGSERKTMRLGSYPTLIGSFQLDLYYRTRMEIEQEPASISPVSDSFHQVASAGTTPEGPPAFGSPPGTPSSFCDVISHFSTSPASLATSPPFASSPPLSHVTPPIQFVNRARSRTHSTQSGNSVTADSPEGKYGSLDKEGRERKHSGSSQIVRKDVPFANLLSMSISGSLYGLPLSSLKEEKAEGPKEILKEAKETQGEALGVNEGLDLEDTMVAEHPLPLQLDTSTAASTVIESTVCATVKNSQSEEGEGIKTKKDTGDVDISEDEDDSDSFVKIPLFGTSPSSNSLHAELGDLISSCRNPPSIEEFESTGGEQMETIRKEIERFEKSQCCFDKFVSDIKEQSEEFK